MFLQMIKIFFNRLKRNIYNGFYDYDQKYHWYITNKEILVNQWVSWKVDLLKKISYDDARPNLE